MKKTKFFAWGSMMFALCAMLMVSSCKGEDTGNESGNGGNTTPELPENGMATATFTGIVQSNGRGTLRGVTVTSGDQTVQTDLNGMYKLDRVKVVGGRAVVKFQKTGYMSVVRSLPVQNTVRLDVSMNTCATNTFASSTSKTVSMYDSQWSDQMTVELPADGFVTESGAAYTGQVNAQSVYLDPDDDAFTNSMPGDLTALCADNSEAQLVSYGMVAVELTDGANNKLQLAPGKTATLTFPVPEKFKGGTLPASIPLWSFDEEKGLWIEEGKANLNGAGNAYVGTVTHFSWHNLDQPELRATLKIKVQNSNGAAVGGIKVDVDGERSVITGGDGTASCVVPSNTDMVIRIPSEAYGDYANVWNEQYGYFEFDETKIVKQNVRLSPQEEKTITLTMSDIKAPVISGKITNEGTGIQACVVYIQYSYYETLHVITDFNGNFSLMAPANYRGEATLVAQYGDGYTVKKTFTVTDNDQTINLTANTSSQVITGRILVKGDGINIVYDLPEASDENWNEAVRYSQENGLSVQIFLGQQGKNNNDIWGTMYLNIPEYTEGQTTFTGQSNSFYYNREERGKGWVNLGSEGLTIAVTKSGDNYTFKIENANATLNTMELGEEEVPVKISTEFTAKRETSGN